MKVDVQLRGVLRECLPPPSKGRIVVQLVDGSTVGDLLTQLEVTRRVSTTVNEQHKADSDYVLQDGDRVVVYTLIGGG